MDSNPYEAPRAAVEHPQALQGELATRWRRLGAVSIDVVALVAASLVSDWLLSLAGIQLVGPDDGEDLLDVIWAIDPVADVYGFVLFLMVQGPLLATRAQTIGKMLLQIRIANSEGQRPSFSRIVFLRELPGYLAASTLGTGLVYGLLDALMIFRRDRRCLHDHIAGTRVIVAR